jgi:serine/threonine protein kinase
MSEESCERLATTLKDFDLQATLNDPDKEFTIFPEAIDALVALGTLEDLIEDKNLQAIFYSVYTKKTEQNKSLLEYKLKNYLGEGANGSAFLCTKTDDNTIYVLKFIRVLNVTEYYKEIHAQKIAQDMGFSPRVVAHYSGDRHEVTPSMNIYTVVIMEHSGVQTFANYIDSFNPWFEGIDNVESENYVNWSKHFHLILTTMLNMLEELCKKGFTHGDTHFNNIMISCDDYTYEKFIAVSNEQDMRKYIKLIDFGNAVTTRCDYNRFLYDIFHHLGTYHKVFIDMALKWVLSSEVRKIFLPDSEKANRVAYGKIYKALDATFVGKDFPHVQHAAYAEKIASLYVSKETTDYLNNNNVYMIQFKKYLVTLGKLFPSTTPFDENDYKTLARHIRAILDHIVFDVLIPHMGGMYSYEKASYIDFIIELDPSAFGDLIGNTQWSTSDGVSPHIKAIPLTKTDVKMNFLTLLFTDMFMMDGMFKNIFIQWFIYAKTQERLNSLHATDVFLERIRNLTANGKWKNIITPNSTNTKISMQLLEVSQQTLDGTLIT